MRELQAIFETPPRVRVRFPSLSPTHPPFPASGPTLFPIFVDDTIQYGKSLDWKKENYTTHDVASVFRRYLTHLPVRWPDACARLSALFSHRRCRSRLRFFY